MDLSYGSIKASNIIKVVQNASGHNQRELSRRMGRGERYVERLIHNSRLHRIDTLIGLCEAAGCELLLKTPDGKVFRIENE